MADSSPLLENILSKIDELPLPELEKVSLYVAKTLKSRKAEAQTLLERLRALGVEITPLETGPAERLEQAQPGQRQRPQPKFRSKVNPNLVWTGRGRMAGWLIREMEETGLPPEAFLISPSD